MNPINKGTPRWTPKLQSVAWGPPVWYCEVWETLSLTNAYMGVHLKVLAKKGQLGIQQRDLH